MKKIFLTVIFALWVLFRAWTTPKTWASEPLTSSDLNTYVRDNQNAIKARAENFAILDVSTVITADFTNTDTTFVDVDDGSGTCEVSLTTTTGSGGKVEVAFNGAMSIGGTSKIIYLNIAVDGVDQFADNGFMAASNGTASAIMPINFNVILEGLSVGAHTITLRWKGGDASTKTFYTTGLHPQFWAREI